MLGGWAFPSSQQANTDKPGSSSKITAGRLPGSSSKELSFPSLPISPPQLYFASTALPTAEPAEPTAELRVFFDPEPGVAVLEASDKPSSFM